MQAGNTAIQITQLNSFDGIEHKQAHFMNRHFPVHFHHEWSLAWIETGSEWLLMQNREILLPAGSFVLIPPYAAHANKGNPDASWQYRSIYLNPDAFAYICLSKGLDKDHINRSAYQISRNPILRTSFRNLSQSSLSKDEVEKELKHLFYNFLTGVKTEKKQKNPAQNNSLHVPEIIAFIHEKFRDKMTLDSLSEKFVIEKFRLLRSFRTLAGLTPQEYLTAMRIEHAKKLLRGDFPLVEVAFESGFYDQSHFNHTFLKYVGMSPGNYRRHCNIIQDKPETDY